VLSVEATLDPPPRRDRSQGLKDEIAVCKLAMRNVQPRRSEPAAAPQDKVEVENSRAPRFARTPSEFTFETLQLYQHLRRSEIAFHQRHRIRKVAPCATMSRVQDDGRSIK
jgi:hypothetical protein